MKIISPNVERLSPNEYSPIKRIELIGKTSDQSDFSIVEKHIVEGNMRIFEHGPVYFTIDNEIQGLIREIQVCEDNTFEEIFPYFKYRILENGNLFVSTNIRTLYNMALVSSYFPGFGYLTYEIKKIFPEIGKILPSPNMIDYGTIFNVQQTECLVPTLALETFKITADNAIITNFSHCRNMSYEIEDTEKCDYAKLNFNEQLSVIDPETITENSLGYLLYMDSLSDIEKAYINLRRLGDVPFNIARKILPLGIKTEMYMTGYVFNWNKFFNKYCVKKIHPEARVIAEKIRKILNETYGDATIPM